LHLQLTKSVETNSLATVVIEEGKSDKLVKETLELNFSGGVRDDRTRSSSFKKASLDKKELKIW